MDIIDISNLRLRAVIGFSEHELGARQDIVLSLRLGFERNLAGESDCPADALDYKRISKAMIALVAAARFSLVEKLAEQIAARIILGFGAAWVSVRLHKPGALRHADSVGIIIERRASDYAKNLAYIAIGSNIEPTANVPACVELLRRYTTLLALSPVYRSAPQGYGQQPPFVNLAAKVHTLRNAADFKSTVIDRIEAELKRTRDPANINAPRSIDLDIALWNSEVLRYGKKPWRAPDPDILRYAHVAQPLADIAADYRHPETGQPLSEIAAGLNGQRLERVDLDLGMAVY